MNIQYHIKTLLYRQDCVLVSGLGGFVCQTQSAKIEEAYMIPPSKKVSFNQSLDTTDGLLENHVAREEKISYQIAQQNIIDFSQKIKDTLEEEHEVTLNGLGSFRYNDDGKLVFEPDSNDQWLLEAYGLPKFKITEMPLAEQPKVASVKTIEKKPETTEQPVSSKTPYWKYAAVSLLAIGIAGFIGARVYQDDVEAYNTVQQKEARKLVDQKIQQSSFVISEPLSPLAVEVKQKKTGKYHIVGGAFRIRANVEKKIKQLNQKGYDAQYIGTNTYGLHQVVYGSYVEKEEALKALRQIKAKENRSAWLFVKEL